MTEAGVLDEQVVADAPIPWSVIPGWADRFGVVAGLTGRGTPDDPFDLGLAGTQPVTAVLDRWRAVRAALPSGAGLVVARQVHGRRVLWHERGDGAWAIHEGADGHATAAPGLLLTVSLADCVPVYVVDPVRRAVALLHSGWRGTAANILEAGVAALSRHAGSNPADLTVHVGVGICGACYQVSAEVAAACGRPAAGPNVQLDLRAVVAEQALGLGVPEVTVSTLCSAHDGDRFMSHRRSRGRDGRMVAVLGLLG